MRGPHPNLFPEPIAQQFKGVLLSWPRCAGSGKELEACCAVACNASDTCEFWVVDGFAGPCRLMRAFSGFEPTAKNGSRGMFKAGSLSIDDVLPGRSLKQDLRLLRRELRKPCPMPDWRPPGGRNLSRMRAWVDWALRQEDGQSHDFPEHDVVLSTKACIDRELQWRQEKNPFYLLRESPEGAPRPRPPPRLRRVRRPEDLHAGENEAAFAMMSKPGCPYRPSVWNHVTRPRLSRFRGDGEPPPARDVAIVDSDRKSNPGHFFADLLYLSTAARSGFLKRRGQRLVLVPVWNSFGYPSKKWGKLHRLMQVALGLDGQVEEEPWVKQGDAPAPRCYRLVAQRYWTWPLPPSPYALREKMLRQCGLPDRGLCPRMFFWYKKEVQHHMFVNLEWMLGTLGAWARSVGLHFEASELSDREVDRMTACQQVGVFTDLALYVSVHGAAGLHCSWMPPGAVYVEILNRERYGGSRMHSEGRHAPIAAFTGHLYVRWQHVVPIGFPTKRHAPADSSKYLSLDPRELVAALHVLYANWLQPRLTVARCTAEGQR